VNCEYSCVDDLYEHIKFPNKSPIDGLDIVGVEEVDVVQQHAIDYVERGGVIKSAHPPDADSRPGAGLPGNGSDLYPGNFTLQALFHVSVGNAGHFFRLQRGYGAGQVALSLHPVTNHDHLFEHFQLKGQIDVNRAPLIGTSRVLYPT